jgi:MFS family permease
VTSPPSPPSLRSIGLPAFAPTLVYGIGQGAIAPVVALSAIELGASTAVAGLVVGLAGVGQIVGSVPAGWLAGRVGERHAMILASGFVSVALLLCMLAPSVLLLGAAIAATGLAGAVWGLARQAYMTDVAPPELRARALSTLGGCTRVGMFLGPFLGAGVMTLSGTDGAYAVHLVAALATIVLLVRLPDPSVVTAGGAAAQPPLRISTLEVVRGQLPVLRTLGVGVLLVGAARASREAVLPLWGDHIGLDPATTSLVFGASGALDMLLFYPAGYIMDRFGRAWAAVPSMLLLGLTHLALPLTSTTAAPTVVARRWGSATASAAAS